MCSVRNEVLSASDPIMCNSIPLPLGRALALWHFPLPPNLHLMCHHSSSPALPQIYYSFAASRSTELETSWFCNVLTAVLSTKMQKTCWISLAVDSPGQQWIQLALETVLHASIGTARLKHPQPLAITWFVISPPFCMLDTFHDSVHVRVMAYHIYLYFQ